MSKFVNYALLLLFIISGLCCSPSKYLKPRLSPPHVVDELASGDREVIFQYFSPSAKIVTIAGDFNRWGGTSDGHYDPKIDPLSDDGTRGDKIAGDGIWSLRKRLKPGRYQYKFVVDQNTWVTDPNNLESIEQGGYINSLLVVY